MKINKQCKDGEIFIGDVFHFDFKRIMDTPFSNSNFGRDLAEKEVDDVYIHVAFDPERKLNVPSYNIYYVKNDEILSNTFENSAPFFSYVMGKESEGVINRLFNTTNTDLDIQTLRASHTYTPPSNAHESITDKPLNIKTNVGEDIVYGDVVKLDYAKIKESMSGENPLLNKSFMDKLESFNVDALYFHIADMNKTTNHSFSHPRIYIYAVADSQLTNGKTEEENKSTLEYFKESNQDNRKLDTYFERVDGGVYLLEKFYKYNLFEKVSNHTDSVELDISDVNNAPSQDEKSKERIDLLLNMKINDEELMRNDLFRFNFRKLEGSSFEGSNMGAYLRDEKIDDMFIHFLFGANGMNVVGMDIYYIKDNSIHDKDYDQSPSFISYLTGKSACGVFEKMNNIDMRELSVEQLMKKQNIMPSKNQENARNLGLGITDSNGVELKYWDIFKIDYEKVKELNLFGDDYRAILDEKKVESIYCHLLDLNDVYSSYPTSLQFKVYAVSKNGFENANTDEENEEYREVYERTGNPNYKFDTVLFSSFRNPNYVKYMKDKLVVGEIVNNKKANELELSDILEIPKRRLKM